MTAAESSSSTGVQRRVNEIVSELQGYISAGFISVNQVASLLRQEGAPMSKPGTKNDAPEFDQRPSVAEVNVSACSEYRFCI
jgi:hypothetical protein